MIDPTRMERIWAKEPSLCPPNLFRPTEVARPRWEVWVDADPRRWVSIEIPDDVAAALIRDACVWWLADKGNVLIEPQNPEDRTDYLLLAVEAVLDIPKAAC